jgi:hypothetical protein
MALRINKNNNKKEKEIKRNESGLQILTPDEELPKGYLSVSQIEMYLRCPKQYEYRYVKGLIQPPAVALVEGSCHHNALEMNNINKFKNDTDFDSKTVLEKFLDEFADKKKEIPKSEWISSGENANIINERGRNLIKNYMKEVAPTIKPFCLPEKRFEVELGGVPILGFIDLVEEKEVIDYKVTKAAKSQIVADNSIQLSVYSYAEKKKNVSFCCLTKTKASAVRITSSSRNDGDYAAVDAIIGSVVNGIKAGNFPLCDPTNSFPCSEKYCGYWKQCKGIYYK